MSQEDKSNQSPESPVCDAAKETCTATAATSVPPESPISEESPATAEEIPADALIDAEARAQKAEAEAAALKDRYIRLMADFDNMRKRHVRELDEMIVRANERLLKELMPIEDNLELALQNAPEGESTFVDGVRMIDTQFRKALEQSGAVAIDAVGEPFDPNFHEALQMMPNESVPANHVFSQFRKGWKLGSKVIRPAQVLVSAGASAQAE